jgi:hypothetical protein
MIALDFWIGLVDEVDGAAAARCLGPPHTGTLFHYFEHITVLWFMYLVSKAGKF